MYSIKKSIVLFILFLFVAFPSVTYAKASISGLSISQNQSGKTDISINSSGKYKYLVHALKNDLIIVIDDASFDANLIDRFKNYSSNDPNINSINLEQQSDGTARIVINTNNIKDFKFFIDAKNGVAAPYGFDKRVVKASKNNRVSRRPASKPQNQKKSKVTKKKQENKIISSGFNSTNSDVDLFMPGDISNHSASESNRLDLSNVVVPDDYYKKPEPVQVQKTVAEPEIVPPVVEPPKSEVKEEVVIKEVKKPIPMDELMKTLNSSDEEEMDVPRISEESKENADIVTESPPVSVSIESNSKTVSQPSESTNNNNIIKSIKEVPNSSMKKPLVLTPGGTNSTSMALQGEEFKENYEVKDDVKSFIPLQPRELSFLPLGLSEEFNFDEPVVEDDFTIPKPKSAMTSDGMLAFTVITPEGSYEKKAPIKQIASIQNDNNYSYSSSGNNGVIDVDKQFSEEDKLKFKKCIIEAKDYYDSGSSSAAEIKFKQAISLNPQKPWGYIALAGFYEAEGRYQEAIQSYKRAITYLPDKIELLYNIALNYYREDQILKSEKYLNRVISLSPNFVLAYYNLGTIYYKKKEYEKAIDYLNRAVKLNPVLTDAYYNLGLAYLYKDKKEEALNSFKQCSDIDPVDKQCSQMVDKLKI